MSRILMKDSQQIITRFGHSSAEKPATAVKEVAAALKPKDNALSLLFFPDNYELSELASAIRQYFKGTVVGCTSAGQLTGLGFAMDGLSGCSITGSGFTAVPYLIHPLAEQRRQIEKIAADIEETMAHEERKAFGLLLVDGLSEREEPLTENLYRTLGDVSILGGSAGDNLNFDKTWVYYRGKFYRDAAVFTLCLSSYPFYVFKHQHFTPTSKRLVITEAEPASRLIIEINGFPAAEEYARIVGTTVEKLDSVVFSRNPFMLQIGNDYFVRSIVEVVERKFLKLYCAIDTGLVLRIGRGQSMVQSLAVTVADVKKRLGDYAMIFGCDCILRRLEAEDTNLLKPLEKLIRENKIFGFSTYGEQFNSMHVNQTFTGLAIGKLPEQI